MIRVDAALLKEIAGQLTLPLAEPLAAELAHRLPLAEIDTLDRMAIFLAQACHETAGFATLVEYGSGDGPDADPWDDYLTRLYDQRVDLGNTPEVDGDGERYRGRGILQITGRKNYQRLGAEMGLDLEQEPELVETPPVAVRASCLFWTGHRLNDLADERDFMAITRLINGGFNGIEDRGRYWMRAWRALERRS